MQKKSARYQAAGREGEGKEETAALFYDIRGKMQKSRNSSFISMQYLKHVQNISQFFNFAWFMSCVKSSQFLHFDLKKIRARCKNIIDFNIW